MRVAGSVTKPSGQRKQVKVLLFQKSGRGHETQNPVAFTKDLSVGHVHVFSMMFQTVPFAQTTQVLFAFRKGVAGGHAQDSDAGSIT